MDCPKPLVLKCFLSPTPLIKGVTSTPLIKGVRVDREGPGRLLWGQARLQAFSKNDTLICTSSKNKNFGYLWSYGLQLGGIHENDGNEEKNDENDEDNSDSHNPEGLRHTN